MLFFLTMHFQHFAFTRVRAFFCVFVCASFSFFYSECNSNRDSVLSYTSVRSNSSYLGSDEMGSGKESRTQTRGCEMILFRGGGGWYAVYAMLRPLRPVTTRDSSEVGRDLSRDLSHTSRRRTQRWTCFFPSHYASVLFFFSNPRSHVDCLCF